MLPLKLHRLLELAKAEMAGMSRETVQIKAMQILTAALAIWSLSVLAFFLAMHLKPLAIAYLVIGGTLAIGYVLTSTVWRWYEPGLILVFWLAYGPLTLYLYFVHGDASLREYLDSFEYRVRVMPYISQMPAQAH